MSLSPQRLDELRARVALSGVIGRTTRLTKAGREIKACCPFHNEQTPSLPPPFVSSLTLPPVSSLTPPRVSSFPPPFVSSEVETRCADMAFSAGDFPSRYEALSAELKIKKWSRDKKEALAASDWKRLSYFARPPRERVSTSGLGRKFIPSEVEGLDTNGGEVTRDNGARAERENRAVVAPDRTGACR